MTDGFWVKSVLHDRNRGATDGVVITSTDGREVVLSLDGDCCSSSYFEENSLADLQSIVGEKLEKFEEVGARKSDNNDDYDNSTVYHALKVTTDKQELVVDWRNESNGYYDGWCTVTGFEVGPELNRGY